MPLSSDAPPPDFTQGPAMDEDAFLSAVSAGMEAIGPDADLVCLGEMGIANTTAAAALAAALFGGDGAGWVGRGTGVDDAGLARKAETVDAALALHGAALADPLQALRRVGGRELAAMFGAALAARLRSVPIIVDGFVASAAVAPLGRLNPQGLSHVLAGHVSAEAGHRRLLGEMGLAPILDLGMRLGEATGACLAVNVLRGALACHEGMATFAEAGVSDG
jgi:nicotinate-nucleotide--dimethylbenzimidazole phosphoribosyltransferase